MIIRSILMALCLVFIVGCGSEAPVASKACCGVPQLAFGEPPAEGDTESNTVTKVYHIGETLYDQLVALQGISDPDDPNLGKVQITVTKIVIAEPDNGNDP